MKNKAILFDMDGTILDTLEDLFESVNELLRKLGHPARTKDEVRLATGHGVRHLIATTLPAGMTDAYVDRAILDYKEIYKRNMHNHTAPYNGIPEMIQAVRDLGYKTGVLSNKPDYATKILCDTMFEGLIDIPLGDRPDIKRKPAPDGVYLLLEKLQADAAQSYFVGDSDVDIQTGKNAGLTTIGVSWGLRDEALLQEEGADVIIHMPEELTALLEK
ncbi:HAD family hydrolase [Christensenellaceae bacterium OttesenSCG-928-K19]|nr:HAD family hydrolase [Christensenellaceae bacterium OttesenSCG-928-K19]